MRPQVLSRGAGARGQAVPEDAGPASVPATSAARHVAHPWARTATAVVFALVAVVLALIHFRASPIYPTGNALQSDLYVYQEIGNSWVHGFLPYRDVFDVKGPSFLLLFGVFAWIMPWSMGPPLAVLTLLAFTSLCLAYAIARIHVRGRALAALAAVVSCMVVYLVPSGVKSSFTVEALTVPGVLLLLWLVSRWLVGGDEVPGTLWVLDGAVLGFLLWAKFPVIAPWGGMLMALAVLAIFRGLGFGALWRVVVLHLAGIGAVSAVVLAVYAPVLPDMLRAYFVAKTSTFHLSHELPAEVDFVGTIFSDSTEAALALLAVLLVLLVGVARGDRRGGLALTIAFSLSLWASVAVVRHPYNVIVPLSFTAVVAPRLLAAAESRGRSAAIGAAVGLTAMVSAACVAPLAQGVTVYGLFWHRQQLTCYDLVNMHRQTVRGNVTTTFARAAGNEPILSVGSMFSARTSFLSHLPVSHPFQFVDGSWSTYTGGDAVQTGYLADKTFDYAWIHITGAQREIRADMRAGRSEFAGLHERIRAGEFTRRPSEPKQAAALERNYAPVLSCGTMILMRAR